MIPDSHQVFAETRLVYRVIELEQELRIKAIHDDQWETIGNIAARLEKYEEMFIKRGAILDALFADRTQMRESVHKMLVKSNQIRQRLGHLTNLTLKRLTALDNRVDNLEEQIQDITSSFARLSVSDKPPRRK